MTLVELQSLAKRLGMPGFAAKQIACLLYTSTAGFGLPVPRSRSILSISGQFVRISGQEATFENENIFRVSIGLTFNERWFFKRRVE